MELITRGEYMERLLEWRDRKIIKVVSGVRRCGKSTLLEMFRARLLEDGAAPEQLISINFEDLEFEELTDYRKLYEYIKPRLCGDRMNYIFLDEIQHCADFQKAVDSLFIMPNCDVYITGSNAYFMSGELATLLSGRYVEIKMLPLSFREYAEGTADSALSERALFEKYITCGSFPFIAQYGIEGREAADYLQGIYSTVLLGDVVRRKSISDVTTLRNVAKYMMYSIGNRVSVTNIANTLRSSGTAADGKTVSKYLDGLTESLLLYEAARYDVKGKKLLSTQSKYYVVDVALRGLLVRNRESDIGHILENVVYLELLRRGYEVCVGEVDGGEVDFVAIKNGAHEYYQVSATTLDETTLRRELAPFGRINDNYPKYLLTLDEVFAAADYDGIRKLNVISWLLGKFNI